MGGKKFSEPSLEEKNYFFENVEGNEARILFEASNRASTFVIFVKIVVKRFGLNFQV